jgi:hypothetical protein
MRRYRLELGNAADDADLREILAATPMAGAISLAFRRDPSYFAAAVVEGDFRQVVVARDLDSGRVVGFGARSVSRRFVNGRECSIGYLSGLRILAEHRRSSLLGRGFHFFRELHEDRRAQLYLTTIAADNRPALDALTSGRGGVPRYHPAGDYHTLAIPADAVPDSVGRQHGFICRQAEASDMEPILEFLRAQGPRRQFFPCDLLGSSLANTGELRGLDLENFVLAERSDELVGVGAAWDQRAFRQTVVHQYSGAMRWLRPAYNTWARASRRPALPPAGSVLRTVFTARLVVLQDDPAVFVALKAQLRQKARVSGAHYLLVGMHADDPLWPAARSLSARRYTTRLFYVAWEDEQELLDSLDERAPYLELGSL